MTQGGIIIKAWCNPRVMSEPAIEVKDPSRIRCLVMPSPRAPGGRAMAAGPLEMATRSIQFPSSASGGASLAPKPQPVLGPPMAELPCAPQTALVLPGWTAQAVYAVCGLLLGLCNLVAPDYIQPCAHLLCPAWSLALALHVVACGSEPLWAWAGALTFALLPFVIAVGAPLFVGFYLLVFAAFSSGAFWVRLQGPAFILAWLCWAGFFLSCGLGFGALPVQMHLSVAAFFSISLGVLNSGCPGKFVVRAG